MSTIMMDIMLLIGRMAPDQPAAAGIRHHGYRDWQKAYTFNARKKK